MQTVSSTELPTSPLQEVEKESLSELFARDPLSLTADNIETICKTLRAQRHQWMIEEKTKASKVRGKAAAKPNLLNDSQMADLLDGLKLD